MEGTSTTSMRQHRLQIRCGSQWMEAGENAGQGFTLRHLSEHQPNAPACLKEGTMSGKRATCSASIVLALFGAAANGALITSEAEVLHDLTGGGQVTINGARFVTVDQQPTGSGVIHSFVRVSAANQGIVEGYNTDGRPLQFDENTTHTFTRSQLLSDLKIVTRNGQQYYQFLLDINQEASRPLLTLNEL